MFPLKIDHIHFETHFEQKAFTTAQYLTVFLRELEIFERQIMNCFQVKSGRQQPI